MRDSRGSACATQATPPSLFCIAAIPSQACAQWPGSAMPRLFDQTLIWPHVDLCIAAHVIIGHGTKRRTSESRRRSRQFTPNQHALLASMADLSPRARRTGTRLQVAEVIGSRRDEMHDAPRKPKVEAAEREKAARLVAHWRRPRHRCPRSTFRSYCRVGPSPRRGGWHRAPALPLLISLRKEALDRDHGRRRARIWRWRRGI